MTKYNKQSGFGVVEALLILVVVGILGFASWFMLHHSKSTASKSTSAHVMTQSTKPKNQTGTTPQVTAASLIAVAKQVYYQTSADGSNPPGVSTCAVQDFGACPFTTTLSAKISNAQKPSYYPSPAGVLIAGTQNGPFGTLAYNAVPAAQGGTVTVIATPDASLGDPILTWRLTVTRVNGKLLVNDITYTEGAFANTKPCGPVEIYNYISCYQ